MIWVDESGAILYAGSRDFISNEDIRIRQNPEEWWGLLDEMFMEVRGTLPSSFFNDFVLKTIGVTSTSGTVIPMGENGKVLYGAIMYSDPRSQRSEEHTSELQSRGHLVCRLLLEKKKKKRTERKSTL